jgi:hypothetical protein
VFEIPVGFELEPKSGMIWCKGPTQIEGCSVRRRRIRNRRRRSKISSSKRRSRRRRRASV